MKTKPASKISKKSSKKSSTAPAASKTAGYSTRKKKSQVQDQDQDQDQVHHGIAQFTLTNSQDQNPPTDTSEAEGTDSEEENFSDEGDADPQDDPVSPPQSPTSSKPKKKNSKAKSNPTTADFVPEISSVPQDGPPRKSRAPSTPTTIIVEDVTPAGADKPRIPSASRFQGSTLTSGTPTSLSPAAMKQRSMDVLNYCGFHITCNIIWGFTSYLFTLTLQPTRVNT